MSSGDNEESHLNGSESDDAANDSGNGNDPTVLPALPPPRAPPNSRAATGCAQQASEAGG